MRKITGLAVSGAFVLAASASAFADSKSLAEFLLKTCLPAMDDISKVEVMAREDNWTVLPTRATSSPRWEVIQGQDKFNLNARTSHYGQQDYNICFVSSLNNDVDIEELVTFIAASVQLTPIYDNWIAQTNTRSQAYEINSDRITRDRAKPVRLFITSTSPPEYSKVDTVGFAQRFPWLLNLPTRE